MNFPLIAWGFAFLWWTAAAIAAPDWLDASWAGNPAWDDGKAEVSTYDSTTTIYGKARPHETVMIVVKEDLSSRLHVKADDPARDPAPTPALKFALLSGRIETENYPYDYAITAFHDRRDLSRCVRAVATSHEWCGITFKEIQGWTDPPTLRGYSYWDGEGSVERRLPPGTIPAESLFLLARALVPGREAQMAVVGPLLTTRLPKTDGEEWNVRIAPETEKVHTGAGFFLCRKVEAGPAGKPLMTMWVEAAFPNRLIRALGNGGQEFSLRENRRWDYWVRRP